ncbi:protein LSM12 homolog A-like [Amphiura filiformis]|uniref:protein LSM12 homolog A-like n=1 Tax=Amphiura filiformis TaxID=82378 RepID=UPI003B2183EE
MAVNSEGASGDNPLKVGNVLVCVTCFGERIEGEVMSFDGNSMIALKKKPAGDQRRGIYDVTLVNLSLCNDVQIVHESTTPPPELPTLNTRKIEKRVSDSVAEKKMAIRLQKEGISPAVQLLFRTINKTLSCKWQGKNIIVLDDVVVKPPYTTDTLQGSDDAVAQVRKIIEKHNRDLQQQAAGNSSS